MIYVLEIKKNKKWEEKKDLKHFTHTASFIIYVL